MQLHDGTVLHEFTSERHPCANNVPTLLGRLGKTVSTHPHPVLTSRLELTCEPSAVRWARRHATDILTRWQITANTVDSAELVVSELATNAARHTGTSEAPPPHGTRARVQTFVLALCLTHSRLFIEVYDEDRAPPVMKRVSDASESGRGLHLVEALSRRWGSYHPTPESGKVVWCELPLVSADDGQAAAVQRVPHARSGPQVGS
jgi:anti-sigma regulatory factor (Ser/Thr protein kinase)